MSRGKDDEVRAVVAELDEILGALRGNVEALSAILAPTDPPGAAEEEHLDHA